MGTTQSTMAMADDKEWCSIQAALDTHPAPADGTVHADDHQQHVLDDIIAQDRLGTDNESDPADDNDGDGSGTNGGGGEEWTVLEKADHGPRKTRALAYSVSTFDTPQDWAANRATVRRHMWLPDHGVLITAIKRDSQTAKAACVFAARPARTLPEAGTNAPDAHWIDLPDAVALAGVELAHALGKAQRAEARLSSVVYCEAIAAVRF